VTYSNLKFIKVTHIHVIWAVKITVLFAIKLINILLTIKVTDISLIIQVTYNFIYNQID